MLSTTIARQAPCECMIVYIRSAVPFIEDHHHTLVLLVTLASLSVLQDLSAVVQGESSVGEAITMDTFRQLYKSVTISACIRYNDASKYRESTGKIQPIFVIRIEQ